MNPFQSLRDYELRVYTLPQQFPSIVGSTLVVAQRGRQVAEVIGELTFRDDYRKHIPPDIKAHRVPAPGLSFSGPNLPFLIQEIDGLLPS